MFYLQADPTMSSPWLDPKFLWGLIVAGVFLVLWFGRLEFKTNANKERQEEHEVVFEKELEDAKGERHEIKTALYKHIGDMNMHHNEREFAEFKKGLDLRFNGLQDSMRDMKTSTQTSLGEINRKLDHLADRD